MKLYRCHGCEPPAVFEAARPACPACGADPARDPRDKALVVELAVVHLDPPHPTRPNRGLGHLACDPAVAVPRGDGVRFTGEPVAVTCRACRQTDAFRRLTPAGGVPAEADAEVLVAPAGPTTPPEE